MKRRFWFNDETYDFKPLYEAIKKYYPLGAIHDAEDYQDDSSESLLRYDTIHKGVYTRSHYSAKWREVKKYLQKEVSKKIKTNHFLPDPCFQGSLLLDQKGVDGLKWTKELHFSICLLGPFYTIFGLDSTEISLEREKMFSEDQEPKWQRFSRAHAVTVSPVFEYKEAFLLLQEKISNWFEGYKFVPYNINMMEIDGLATEVYQKNKSLTGTVYSALFSSYIELDAPIRGDDRYGYQEWRKPVTLTDEDLRKQQQLEASKLKSKEQAGSKEVSLHKLWKYKELIKLPQLTRAFISIPTYSLLDFTEPGLLLFTTEKTDIPQATKYEVVGEEIRLDSVNHYWFKIAFISERDLRLIFHINLEAGEKKIKGDLVELVFERY
ncbi:hypothetical protein [Rufibacter aurantiacus]|uniref:hypothetical protein n=1 Tax=Rufibacter aurantiacus TaxID=2817374 RepID=UPI001B30D7BF|nr:hypothetical protein [Rufibacter aurantiacus]